MQAPDKQTNSNVVDQFSEACQATLDRVLGNNSACVFASVTSWTAGLIVLAQALSRQTGDLVMALDGVELGICPSTGTIQAASSEVMLQAKQLLGQPGWQLREAVGSQVANGHAESLDIFMIRAGIHHGEALPMFPLEGSRMKCWPDLGTAPDLIEPLRVASLLAKGHRDLQKVAGLTGIEPVQASGILWGFQAAGLIVPDQQKMPSPHPKTASNDRLPAAGLFQKLAAIEKIAPGTPVVIGLTKTDLLAKPDLRSLRANLAEQGLVLPVFSFDARDKAQANHMVRALLASID